MSIYRPIPTVTGRPPIESHRRTRWAQYVVSADLICRGFDVAPPSPHIVADCRRFSLRVAVQIAKFRDLADGRRRYRADWRRARYADVIALVDPDDGEIVYADVRTRTQVDVRAETGQAATA